MAKEYLTDEEVEREITRLRGSEAVKLGQKEHQFKYRRRQVMYQLRWYEKRGLELMDKGVVPEDFDILGDDEEIGEETCR